MSAAAPLRVRHVDSLAAIASNDWNRLFPGRAEDWGYFRACELAGPQGFATSAIVAYAGDELVAAAPLFRTDYRLDMSLEGPLQRPVAWIYDRAPKLVAVPMLGVGSPLTEECPIGFAPGMPLEARTATLQALLAGLDAHAAAESVPLLALKDITHRDNLWAQAPLADAGFTGHADAAYRHAAPAVRQRRRVSRLALRQHALEPEEEIEAGRATSTSSFASRSTASRRKSRRCSRRRTRIASPTTAPSTTCLTRTSVRCWPASAEMRASCCAASTVSWSASTST